MGIGGISPGSLLVILLIVVLLFGSKRLRSLGEDLGVAFKGFRKGFNKHNEENTDTDIDTSKDV